MNRIILIGNGFDLAHKLKTSYYNFISYYWSIKYSNFLDDLNCRRLPLSSRQIDSNYDLCNYIKDPDISIDNIIGNIYIPNKNVDENFFGYAKLTQLVEYIQHNYYRNTRLTIKNKFLKRILDVQKYQYWVNIEEEYFKALLDCNEQEENIEILNNEFKKLQDALENYLYDEYNNHNIDKIYKIENLIYSDLNRGDFLYEIENGVKLNNILILNFNYTQTINKYNLNKDNTKIINIHGELKNTNNPIIFGYGDDVGEQYKFLEKINKNRILVNMKSIKYSKTNNYKEMIAFLNSDDYQVFIFGHSCGVSDRTLLNTIFELDKCKSIKIYYYINDKGEDNYLDTFINLSRNFINKEKMREIVVSKRNSETLT